MGTLALRSNNLNDIVEAFNLDGWTHTKRSSKVKVGDTVIIFANKGVCRKAGIDWKNQVVLAGQLTEEPYALDREDNRWPSNREGTDKSYYIRFELRGMRLVPFSQFPEIRDDLDTVVGHLNGGRYYE